MRSLYKPVLVGELPALSWLWIRSHARPTATLYHGPSVEVSPESFFEGAWAGTYSEGAFGESAEVFGSGATAVARGTLFVTPSHTLECLYLWTSDRRTIVSNSLAFLLSFVDGSLQPTNWSYGSILCSIVLGLAHSPNRIPCTRGELRAIYHHNLVVADDATIELVSKRRADRFASYESYFSYLRTTVQETCDNAADRGRRRPYSPLSTISSGYDSVACAVLAAEVGCREAVTITGSRQEGSDSGAELARRLGLSPAEFPRVEGMPSRDHPEAEFLATGMQAEDFSFLAFEPRLVGRLLFTGFHGDKVWEKTIPPNDTIIRGDVSGASLGEFRLRVGFIHLPVPFVGCLNHHDIWTIANSEEMSPYSVGGDYDRPIPRRLVEDAGISRNSFGQRKRAVTVHFFRRPDILSLATRRAIHEFTARQQISFGDRLRYAQLAIRWHAGVGAVTLFKLLRRLRSRGRPSTRSTRGQSLFKHLFRDSYSRLEHSHPRNTTWLLWALEQIRQRYSLISNSRD